MLFVSRSMHLWTITCISSLRSCHEVWFPLFRSSNFSINSQYLLLFLKSSTSCVLFRPTPFAYVICSSMESWRSQSVIWIRQNVLDFLRCILLFYTSRSVISYFLLTYEVLSSQFSSRNWFCRSLNTTSAIFLVSRSLSCIIQSAQISHDAGLTLVHLVGDPNGTFPDIGSLSKLCLLIAFYHPYKSLIWILTYPVYISSKIMFFCEEWPQFSITDKEER